VRNALPPLILAALGFAALSVACRDASPPATRAAEPVAVAPRPSPTPAPPAAPPAPLETLQAEGRPPLELSASSIPGHQPLPTYRAIVRNASDRPVRRVIATVVYRDEAGREMPGEKHDVAFGSPRKAIDPGVTLETSFLSRVEHAPSVRLVVRSVTFLEVGIGPDPVPKEWTNPRYAVELAKAGRER
jgi:hypothetical protein